MELVYTVTKPHRGWRRDWLFRDETPMITVSPRNAIAFCTTVDLNDEDDEGYQSNRSLVEMVHYVYVCDIDKPWSLCQLIAIPEKVVGLEWHHTGSKLLVATALGTIYVWQMKDFLLNSWAEPWKANISGEEIVAVSWLHQGTRLTFLPERRDVVSYSEKHVNASFMPSITHFGGKAVDGLLAVTATGMAVVTLPSLGSNDMKIHMEMLSPSRRRICVADIAFSSKGEILVATSDGSITSAILCYKIALKLENDVCNITCTPMTSFYARCHLDMALRESPTAHITHVKYMHQEAGDSVIVCAGDTTVSHVELWNLILAPITIHRLFINNLSPEKIATGFVQEKWMLKSTITHTSLPTSIAVPRFPVSYGMVPPSDPSSLLFQYIAIAYKDGSVKLVNKHTFVPMTTTNLDTGIIDLENPEKRRKSVAYMTHMRQSFTGCVLVGVDQYSCMYVMKVVNSRDPVTQVPAIFIVCMLEYVLLTGLDWWDVLSAIKPGMVESVVQKLSDNFSKQTGFLQEQLICRLLAMKAAVYKCGTTGQFRAADCHARLVLHSISSHFRSMLRPKVLSPNEMLPSDKLTMTCNKSLDTDIDSVLMTLNSEKKYVVDLATLQSMQQLIQWVADLTTYILACVPLMLHNQHSAFPGATLLHDTRVLGMLRELLVIIRLWGLVSSSCLPNFTTTTNMSDCLPQLFKLLTKVWLAVESGRDFDEALAEECSALASQIMLPAPDEGLFGNTDYSSSIFAQNFPLPYTFGETPSHLSSLHNSSLAFILPQGVLHSKCRKDVVRQIVLGVHTGEPLRVCVRCGCVSLIRNFGKLAAMKAWELRFERCCVCGGQWKTDQSGKKKPVSS